MPDDEPKVKRSRFDQTEPEPRKASRFDRRSRSPPSRSTDVGRSRSPMGHHSRSPAPSDQTSTSQDPTAAAAAAAAKINAELQARKGIQHTDVPPIRSTASPALQAASPSTGQAASKLSDEIYIADGDYIRDIEVNDLRNRYTLTKGSTQKMIKEDTGADVTTRGSYYPDKSMATAANPPLYLHITSTTKAGLEKAVTKIEDLMQQELPNLVDERRFRRREPDQVERDEFGRKKWPEERIPIDMEPIPGFNLRAQVVGHGGSYVKHVQQETRCRVQIKGRGSGFMEHSTGAESDEPMYLHVAGPDPNEVQRAKELCEDLLSNVREQYERFKANPPPQRMESYTDGYGANASNNSYGSRDHYGGRGSYGGGRGRDHYSGQSRDSYASPYSPAPSQAAPPGMSGPQADYAAQYAQYYGQQGGTDPYAAYGGYQNYVAYYQYYAQQQAQQQQPTGPEAPQLGGAEVRAGAAGGASPPPPPPPAAANVGSPTSSAPPPPPPSGGGSSYSAVPPPPGM